jgi:Ca2+-binding EF-hand superfamily protein
MSQATTAAEAAQPTAPSSTTTTTTTKMGSSSSYLTRTKTFEKLAKYAFAMCNSDKESGKIDKTELYAGILLVHLNLAKYAGAAACYPPSRATVEKLFDVVDVDNSKTIDEQEFIHILKICSVDIASRVFVYYR